MNDSMKQKRDAAARWTSFNPVLAAGQIGLETDTGKMKFGNGVAAWNALPYFGGLSDSEFYAKVLAAALEGLGPISGYAASSIVASDTILNAFGKLQKQIASRATLSSPAFTGTPTAPTALSGTNTNQLATTAFVQNAVPKIIEISNLEEIHNLTFSEGDANIYIRIMSEIHLQGGVFVVQGTNVIIEGVNGGGLSYGYLSAENAVNSSFINFGGNTETLQMTAGRGCLVEGCGGASLALYGAAIVLNNTFTAITVNGSGAVVVGNAANTITDNSSGTSLISNNSV